ncbi:tetratricopeptide repeat protein [Aquimarina sp. SS2-1]|uniref:tetratricopeptide repeat-containing sensor histidine kinase n=1 Tax=Aquimarina besae TaxID=3342247 RepID=UPI00366BDBEF
MKHILASFLFFISMSFFSQEIQTNELQKLANTITQFGKLKNVDSALYCSKQLLSKSIRLEDTTYILKAYNNLAKYNRVSKKYFAAVKYYAKSKELNLRIGDTNKAINKLRRISIIQSTLGDFNSSESNAIEALKLAKSLSDSIARTHQLAIYNDLGITSKRLKNFRDASIWYHKALAITENALNRITIKNNIAIINIEKKEYSEAIENLSLLIKEAILAKAPEVKARIIDNLAYAKSKLNYPKAEEQLLNALQLRKKINDLSGQFASNIHLTEHYQDQNQDKKALFHASQAYQIGHKLKSATSKAEALSYLIELKENPKKEAIEYRKLTDSIYTAREQAKNQFAKIRYETEENRRRILTLKKEKAEQQVAIQKQKNQRLILISLISLLCLTIGFIIYYLIQRNKTDRIKERHSTEKRLSKKLHDEVGNDVFYLMSQLKNISEQSQKTNNAEIIDGLDAVYHKVRDFSRDHTIETGAEYGDELLSLLNSYGNQDIKIFTNTWEGDIWTNIADYKKVELYWVLKELLTNMKKHSKATVVSLSVTKGKNNIVITYTDNGIGMDFTTSQKSKNGLNNVENRIKEIKGTITFETKPSEGFKAIIEFAP